MRTLLTTFLIIFALSVKGQVDGQFFFNQETNYVVSSAGFYEGGTTQYWTNIVDCNSLFCMWGMKYFPFSETGHISGRRVSVYRNFMESEMIIFHDGSMAIVKFNFINGDYRNKIILTK